MMRASRIEKGDIRYICGVCGIRGPRHGGHLRPPEPEGGGVGCTHHARKRPSWPNQRLQKSTSKVPGLALLLSYQPHSGFALRLGGTITTWPSPHQCSLSRAERIAYTAHHHPRTQSRLRDQKAIAAAFSSID